MPLRSFIVLSLCALTAASVALAQTRVRTETIRPPDSVQPPPPGGGFVGTRYKADGHLVRSGQKSEPEPEIITNLTKLPAAVARMRERIVTAARSGELHQIVAVMEAGDRMPVFSFTQDTAPIVAWKSTYPDSQGIELLAILLSILDAGFVHVGLGTAEEVYVWPYFARTPLRMLTPQQKVELFRIVTGADYKAMAELGAYSFYRLGIAPDGTWMYFVSGD